MQSGADEFSSTTTVACLQRGLLLVALLSAGCGGGSGTQSQPDNNGDAATDADGRFRTAGYVDIVDAVGSDKVTLDAGFVSLRSAISQRELDDYLQTLTRGCTVSSGNALSTPQASASATADLLPRVTQPQTIDAGDRLTISHTPADGSAVLAELQRQSAGGMTVYATERDVVRVEAEAPLIIDIPGRRFPAFSGIVLPELPPLSSEAARTLTALTPSTVFTWVPVPDPPAPLVEVQTTTTRERRDDALVVTIVATSVDVLTGNTTRVQCSTNDSGRFAFPAAIRAELGAGFYSLNHRLSRQRVSVLQHADAVLLILHRRIQ